MCYEVCYTEVYEFICNDHIPTTFTDYPAAVDGRFHRARLALIQFSSTRASV